MKYFDAHSHVQFAAYNEPGERGAVLARAREAEVGMIVVGTQWDTSRAAVELADPTQERWAAIALHPIHTSKSFHDAQELGAEGKEFTSRGEVFDTAAYEALARDPKVVAIGECGLDYYRLTEETKRTQHEAFVAQIELANKVGKPLMLHIRASKGTVDAYDDTLTLLRQHARVRGNVHFFAGNWDVAKQFLDLGFALSFTGVITFAHEYDEVVRNAPLDMLLSETDAPYITPVPHRGKRNEPLYVREVVKKIAELKGMEEGLVAERLIENVRRVYLI